MDINNQDVEMDEDYSLSIIERLNMEKIQNSMDKIYQFQKMLQNTLVEGHDYGKTFYGSSRPSLLKAGAEKILMLLGISSEYEIMDKIQDYEEGFFAYSIKCVLTKNERIVTEGMGHCNSKEKKYTGAKQDVYMLGNTCLKMAKKRALVDATLTVASLSDIFTQDLEDIKAFEEEEKLETMTLEEAKNLRIGFGKYSGKTLGQIYNNDSGYIRWLSDKARDDSVMQACKKILEADFNTNEVQQKANKMPPE